MKCIQIYRVFRTVFGTWMTFFLNVCFGPISQQCAMYTVFTRCMSISQSSGTCPVPHYLECPPLVIRPSPHVCQKGHDCSGWTPCLPLVLNANALTTQRNVKLGQKLAQIAYFSKFPGRQAIAYLNLSLLLCRIWKKISDAKIFPFEEWGSPTGPNIFDFSWERHLVLTGKMIATKRDTATGRRCEGDKQMQRCPFCEHRRYKHPGYH